MGQTHQFEYTNGSMRPSTSRPLLSSCKFGFLTLAAGAVIGGCASSAPTTSTLATTPPRIDARLSDWEKPSSGKDEDVLVRVMNDGEFVYVSMATRDESIIPQVLARGLTVWFDPAGGKEKRFGVTFPRGVAATRDGFAGRRGSAGRPDGAGRPDRSAMPDGAGRPDGTGAPQGGGGARRGGRNGGMDEAFQRSLETVQFMYDGAGGQIYPSGSVPGVELAADVYLNELTVEMKIPLVVSDEHQIAVGAQPGATVGVGLVTPDFEASTAGAGAAGGGGMGRGGGRGGRGGGRGGAAAMAAGGQGGGLAMKPLKHWIVVELAN